MPVNWRHSRATGLARPPWQLAGMLTYTDRFGASWTSWIVGAIAVVLGGSAVPASNRAHREAIQH
jgi:hypothetical protein